MTRIESLADEVAQLDSVLSQHQSALQARKIALVRQYDDNEKFELWGDPVRLRQLLDNLLINSLKYTDEGGELRLGLSVDGLLALGVVADGENSDR